MTVKGRRATVSLLYNGVSATTQVAGYLRTFKYTDVASGSSDSLSVELNDPDRKWIGAWFPQKGDKLKPTIQTEDWESDGQSMKFQCGTFEVDDFSFKGGPITMSLDALALPAESSFKTTSRSVTYEKTTLEEIGKTVAERAGISLYYEADKVTIEKVEQSNQNDCEFYKKLVEQYGLAMKIYDDKLVVFSEAIYEGKDAKATLQESDFDPGWSWDTQLVGTYTGVQYEYTNSDKNQTFMVTAGGGDRILTCNDAADNLTEATSIALAALNNANKGTTTMSVTIKAIPGLIASDCVEIKGLSNLDGKYYIEQITHNVGSGYTMDLELRRVEQRFTEESSISWINPS
jgi:hypothetical protein